MIREMKRRDFKAVLKIYKQGIDSGIATFTSSLPSFYSFNKSHLPYLRYVYELDSKIVGFIVLSKVSSRDVYNGVAELSIYVDNEYKRKGVGTELLTKLMSECHKHNIYSLFSTILSNNTSSIEFHKKMGFREIGYKELVAKDIHGVYQNTTLMEYRFK